MAFEERYDELTRQARNDAFQHHWGAATSSPEVWRHTVTGHRGFQPDLSFLLLSPARDRVIAFVIGKHFESGTTAPGRRELHLDIVGTRAEFRGRGLATALLGHTLRTARDAGFDRSSLGVDYENADGALRIYERCGYRVVGRSASYALPAEPPPVAARPSGGSAAG